MSRAAGTDDVFSGFSLLEEDSELVDAVGCRAFRFNETIAITTLVTRECTPPRTRNVNVGDRVWTCTARHPDSTRLITPDPAYVGKVNLIFSTGYELLITEKRPSSSEAYRFTGKPYSSATGLYYNYQRWYDPGIGRFISQDPILGSLSYPQTLNRYTYTVNNPVQFVDPTGEFPLIPILLIAAFLGGLGFAATLSPDVAQYTDPAMTLVGVIPVLGDFTADPYFAARDISFCALGRGCDQFQTGLDIAVLLPVVPGALARGKRVANLVDATTHLGRGANRVEDISGIGAFLRRADIDAIVEGTLGFLRKEIPDCRRVCWARRLLASDYQRSGGLVKGRGRS